MTTVVVDANVWISALLPDEPHYLMSQAWIDRWRTLGHDFAGPVSFLTEVGCSLGRRRNYSALARPAVSAIIADAAVSLLPIDQALAVHAADVGITAQLRGADALYVAVAQQLGVPLVTWDAELLTRATKVGVAARIPTL